MLVVEDSLTVRRRLVEVLSSDLELQVVGEAEDGKRAIELCKTLLPDVVTLDMVLPFMSGLAVTEYIMAYCPTPIVIVSSSTNRGEVFRTYDALRAGAIEVVEKPDGREDDDRWQRHLTSTVKLVSRIKVITHPRARLDRRRDTEECAQPSQRLEGRRPCRLIALGASMGGPAAILEILRELPPDFPLPILIVIHVGRPFAAGFMEWLQGQCSIPIGYARDGDPLPEPGFARAVMAPPDQHLVVKGRKLRLTSDPERHSCRPSVDVLFESVASEIGEESAACLLTGMGRDGARGLLAVQRSGGATIAQDEATSVVFGMPREAILLGAADRVLPLQQIAPSFMALARAKEAQ